MSEKVSLPVDFVIGSGARNLLWCYMLNEPGIVTFPQEKDGKPTCPICEGSAETIGELYEDAHHRFMFRILKPPKETS